MERTGAEIIALLLERHGARVVFGIPGGANLPLYDALYASNIRHVLARHEQGAGFMAQGLARATGKAGVCLVSSGPGATNLVTALADAMSDSIPLVAISAQVPTSLIGTNAFQEVDTVGITRSITKKNYFVRSPFELLETIPDAFLVAESGRPGPVLVDVPKDVQTRAASFSDLPERRRPSAAPNPDAETLKRVSSLIDDAERPVLYIGGGVIASGASNEVVAIARRADLAVASSLHGLGAFPSGDPLFLGMLGMHAAPYTHHVLDEADLLVAVGARFDDRATGKPSEFCPRATIVHIDVDAREIGKIKPTRHAVVGDARSVLRTLLPEVRPRSRPEWRARVEALRARHPLSHQPGGAPDFLRALSSRVPKSTVVTTDVGQHQMWVAQAYPFVEPRTLLTSGGLGTMGFGVPAAIGAALSRPNERVLCVTGDGSLLMNIQELATLGELGLDVAVVVLNNGHLGLVRQQQELFYGERYLASRFHHEPDFSAIARGFGIAAFDVPPAHNGKWDFAVLDRALSNPGPMLLNVPISPTEKVFPMVPPGAANRDMIGA